MSKTKLVERDGGNCIAQADDRGFSEIVYVNRRGTSRVVARSHRHDNAEFEEESGLRVCWDCGKYCEPVLTEQRTGGHEVHFCYQCDFDGRVRVLVEDGFADVTTASMIVHRLIAFEHPGADVDRVTVVR